MILLVSPLFLPCAPYSDKAENLLSPLPSFYHIKSSLFRLSSPKCEFRSHLQSTLVDYSKMEVAGGVIAVVSLGIQLAESVQKIRKFLRGVKEAPEELQRLIAKIDMLHGIFNRVNALIEQQRGMPSHHGLIPLFEGALQTCARSVNRLESEIARVQGSSDDGRKALDDRPKKSMRKHHALRAVLRKETVDDLCSVVDESLREMSLVLHLNSTELL